MNQEQRRAHYLNALGIQVWTERNKTTVAAEETAATVPVLAPSSSDVALLDWTR